MMIVFKLTCTACPEQYDAYIDEFTPGREVGYVRLRHGEFSVECPTVGGEVVFSRSSVGDGTFDSAEQRHMYMNIAAIAIMNWWRAHISGYTPRNYVIEY